MKIHLFICLHFSCYYGKWLNPWESSKAMHTHEIRAFDINLRVKKDCTLSPAKYHVKKVYLEDIFIFYAAKYEAFAQANPPKPDLGYEDIVGGNEDVLGYATCARGYIEMVYVQPPARKCGLANVLSALCMMDPEISSNSDRKYIRNVFTKPHNNKVLEQLERHKNNDKVDFLQKCVKLIGLLNKADPHAASFAYLNAARDTGFQYLIVQRLVLDKRICGDEFLHFEVNHILTKKLFDGKTGLIVDEKGSGIPGSGYMANWYFCKR